MKPLNRISAMLREAREVDKLSEKVATLIAVSRRHTVPVSTVEVIQAFNDIESGLISALEARQRAITDESASITNFLKDRK